MHDLPPRQLPALKLLMLLSLASIGFSQSPGPARELTPRQMDEQLQAASILANIIIARGPTPEEVVKLRRIFEELEATRPESVPVKSAFADFLSKTGSHEEAISKWEAANLIEPGKFLRNLGESSLVTGRPLDAARYYRAASAAHPSDSGLHFHLANVLFLFRHELKMEEAEAFQLATHHFAEACRLAPLNAEFARGHAEVFYTAPHPDWKAALQAWLHFKKISPQKEFAFANLARVYQNLGELALAEECLDQIESAKYERIKGRLRARGKEGIGRGK